MSKLLDDFLKTYPIHIDIPVQWGEMDAFQHVNNVVYFRYFESARIACMTQTQMLTTMKKEGTGPIIASTECRYKKPLTYPDSLKVGVRNTDIGTTDFRQEYAIYSTQQDALTTYGSARIVMINYQTGEKTPLSDALKAEIMALV